MKEIGKATDIEEYEEQIDFLEDILSTMEDLQILYGKDKTFSDEYKEIEKSITYIEEMKQELENEKEELEKDKRKEYDEEMYAMNVEFERSRL